MPHTDTGLPFSGSLPQSRHASLKGAESAEKRAPSQVLRYLSLLVSRYPDGLTDQEAADLMNVERSTINARRGQCRGAGLELIESAGSRPGNYDMDNTIWRIAISRING